MRIAVVSTPFVSVPPKAYGGTELIVHELVQGLLRARHQVTLFATGDSSAPRLRFRFACGVWPPDPYVEILHARQVARDIAADRFDVIHVHCPAALAFAEDWRAPVVYTIHHERDEMLSRYYRELRAIRFVAISRRQAELTPWLDCAVVHHGLDPEQYTPGRGEGGHALFLGRLSWCKGPELAVEAARKAGVPLVVAGQPHRDHAPAGWQEEVLEPALRRPGVRWIGEAHGARKRSLLAGARALLLPIRWEEPFGLVIIEAMLSGCPVVAFPRGAAPELIEPGRTGFLVRDVDDMAAALGRMDGFDREACRRRAVERFSSARMTSDYLALYRETLDAQRRSESSEGEAGWTYAP